MIRNILPLLQQLPFVGQLACKSARIPSHKSLASRLCQCNMSTCPQETYKLFATGTSVLLTWNLACRIQKTQKTNKRRTIAPFGLKELFFKYLGHFQNLDLNCSFDGIIPIATKFEPWMSHYHHKALSRLPFETLECFVAAWKAQWNIFQSPEALSEYYFQTSRYV